MWLLCLCVTFVLSDAARPNVVLFLADDLGWNDVGFHGSNVMRTPNIDALAYSGLVLQNYYVTPICTPSRAALMTGKYPIHTGMQHGVLYGMEPRGLPLSEKILPQYLKELGYKTHLVGKWHLGSYKKEYLPMNRGFDTHFGFWTGKIDMFEHTTMEQGTWGFDFRRGFQVAHDLYGHYATDVYTDEAVRVINSHNASEPLFLMVAHSAVHTGNPSEPIRAPDHEIEKFKHINDTQRRKFAAVLSKMDESIGHVFEALNTKGLLENSIVVFSSDNGGAAAGFNDNAGSNYPLKGVKNTLWEGGVRGAGVLWSPLLEKKARVATQRLHITDWLPTILGAAGADTSTLTNLDGINQWECLSKDHAQQRNTILHNIDDVWGSAAITVGEWKLVQGTNYNGVWDNWYGPAERERHYDAGLMHSDKAGTIVQKLGMMPEDTVINDIRNTATINCSKSENITSCNAMTGPCLYNIEADPCEYNNLAESNPEELKAMLSELERANGTAVPPSNHNIEPMGNPKYWGRVWTNFADFNSHGYQHKIHNEIIQEQPDSPNILARIRA